MWLVLTMKKYTSDKQLITTGWKYSVEVALMSSLPFWLACLLVIMKWRPCHNVVLTENKKDTRKQLITPGCRYSVDEFIIVFPCLASAPYSNLHLLLVGNILWLLWCWESGKIQKKYKTFLGEKPGRVMRYCMLWYQLLSFKIETKTKPEGRLTRSKTACVRDFHSFEDRLALLRLVFQHHTCEDLYMNENYYPHYKHLHNYWWLIFKINITSLNTRLMQKKMISASIFGMCFWLGKTRLHAKFQIFRLINFSGPHIWSFPL